MRKLIGRQDWWEVSWESNGTRGVRWKGVEIAEKVELRRGRYLQTWKQNPWGPILSVAHRDLQTGAQVGHYAVRGWRRIISPESYIPHPPVPILSILREDVRLLQPPALELTLPSCRSNLAALVCRLDRDSGSGGWLLLSHVVVQTPPGFKGISLPAHAHPKNYRVHWSVPYPSPYPPPPLCWKPLMLPAQHIALSFTQMVRICA